MSSTTKNHQKPSKTNPKKDILVRNRPKNLKIDAQKGRFIDINHPLISSSNLSFPQVSLLVTPKGFEPLISWMRTRRPKPLDDGASQAIS